MLRSLRHENIVDLLEAFRRKGKLVRGFSRSSTLKLICTWHSVTCSQVVRRGPQHSPGQIVQKALMPSRQPGK